MSRQLIGSMKGNFHTVKIYSRDTDLESYVARLFDNKTGKAYPDADYFTTERNDAIKTARGMLKRAEAEHATVRNPRKRAPRRKSMLRDHTAAVAPKKRKVRKNPKWQDMNAEQRQSLNKARRRRSLRSMAGRAMWSVWSLDVWGNARDGYEINDRSRIVRISIPNRVTADDNTFVKWLQANGHIKKTAQRRLIEIDGDDGLIHLDYKGKPELQFERD